MFNWIENDLEIGPRNWYQVGVSSSKRFLEIEIESSVQLEMTKYDKESSK